MSTSPPTPFPGDLAGDPSGDLVGTLESPRLTAEQRTRVTQELLSEALGCDDEERARGLRCQVVLLHRDVAESIASRYHRRGLPSEDLDQAALEGLVKAANRFDPTLDHDFMSYAVPTIRGEVRRYFRDHGWTVRPPRRVQDLQWRLQHASEMLSQQLGREPRCEELAQSLEVEHSDLDEALQAYGAFTPASLDQTVADDSTATLGTFLATGADEFAATEARMVVEQLLPALSERDRRILALRFCEELTQTEIGEDLGVTQMQVSRLLSRILGQLRIALEDQPT